MEETFTVHQVRELLAMLGHDDTQIESMLDEMRQMPERPGAVGYSDDELKGTARG